MKNSLGVLLRTTALAGSICGFGFSLPANAQSMTDLGTLLGGSKCLSSELLNDIRYL